MKTGRHEGSRTAIKECGRVWFRVTSGQEGGEVQAEKVAKFSSTLAVEEEQLKQLKSVLGTQVGLLEKCRSLQ